MTGFAAPTVDDTETHDPHATNGVAGFQTPEVDDSGQPPAKPPLMSTSWAKLGSEVWGNLSSNFTAPHLPGSSQPQSAFAGQDQPDAPMYAPLMHGIGRGVQDVVDEGKKLGARAGDATGITDGATDRTTAVSEASKGAFKDRYGDSSTASIGRVAGQTLATAPFLGVGGRVVTAGAGALERAAPTLAPALRLLTGGAGAETTGIPGVATRAASRVVPGAATGAAQAALTGDDIEKGAVAGGVFAPAAGIVLDPVARLMQRLTGRYIPTNAQGDIPDIVQERGRQAQILTKEGVPITAGQVSNDPVLAVSNAITSHVPGSGAITNVSEQADAVRRAAIARMGFDPAQGGQTIPSVATSRVLDQADTRIGNQFDTLASRINGQAPPALGTRLAQIETDLPGQLGANELPIIQRQIDNIRQTLANNNGVLNGNTYQDLVGAQSSLGKLLRGSASPDVKLQAAALRDVVNDAAMTLAPQGDQLGWRVARSQYRALKTIEDATTSSKSTLGDFQPKDLLAATNRANKRFGGTGTLDDLAEASHSLVQPHIDSQAMNKGITAGVAGGAGAGATIAALTNPAMLANPYTAATAIGLLGVSPALQGANRRGTANAIATATSGNAPRDISRALQLLTQGATAWQQAP